MILVKLNQRWMCKKRKYFKNVEWQEKDDRLINESAFVVLNFIIWLIEKDFESFLVFDEILIISPDDDSLEPKRYSVDFASQ